MIYYIYEVPGEKNGATKDWETRRAYNFNEYQIEPIIVETMEGPDTKEMWKVVGDREWYYADLNGYERGKHYVEMMLMILSRTPESYANASKEGYQTESFKEHARSNFDKFNKASLIKAGTKSGKSKRLITFDIAQEIRSKYIPHKYTTKMLSKEYNIKETTIKALLQGRSYMTP